MKPRVVITGLGAVTPLANSMAETWKGLLAGKSGVAPVMGIDTEGLSTTIAAQIKDLDAEPFIDRKMLRRLDPSEVFCLVASQMAIEDSGIDLEKADKERCGVVTGSGIGGIQTLEAQHRTMMDRGAGKVSPFFVPMMIIDMCAGMTAMRFGFQGPNYSTVSACASSAHALADAFRIIQRGEADLMLAGGAEAAITKLSMAGFCAARALSRRNDEPEKASRPFDRDRDGFVMGEGAALLVLESLESARARGARIYAEIIGAGMTCDAHHFTAPLPDGGGAARAIKLALADASLQPEQVNYVNSHGTATDLGDIAETKAIRQIFGDHADRLIINSTKSMVGHLLGAAGGIETAVTALSIHEGRLHPTINLDNPDPECDLNYLANKGTEAKVEVAISNSFGFGGHNITLALASHELN